MKPLLLSTKEKLIIIASLQERFEIYIERFGRVVYLLDAMAENERADNTALLSERQQYGQESREIKALIAKLQASFK